MHQKRILIVEDNYDNRVIYVEILRHAGYDVIEAVNGAEGIEKAREHRPDLILMDLSMPVLDGWQAVAKLREDPSFQEIPILALSAHVLVEGAYNRAVEAGFIDYLTKPLEPGQVLRVVRRMIGPPPAEGSSHDPP